MSLVGNLADLPLTDIFQIVSLSKRTGVLSITTSEERASITFLNGNAIKASSTRNKTSLGSFLKGKGCITDKDIAMALDAQKETREPFGTLLVRKDIVARDLMETTLREYIQTIIVELLTWEEGHFEFKLLSSPEEVLPLNGFELILQDGIDTQHLIIEGLRLLDEKRHRANSEDKKELKDIGFSSMMEEAPVSVAESDPKPPPSENSGHPEGLWESLQDEMDVDNGEAPAARPRDPEDLTFLEQLFLEVGEDFELEEEAPQEHGEISSLKSMVDELKGPNSLSEVLLLILRYADEFMNRAALFVVREGEIRGFGQFGLAGEDNKANDRIRNTKIPEESDSILAEVARLRSKVQRPLDEESAWDRYLLKNLGEQPPKEAVVLPVINNNTTIALLYGDNGPEGKPIGEIEALEIFIIQAGFVLDRFLLESKIQDIQRR